MLFLKKSSLHLSLISILLFSFLLKLRYLGHRELGISDECCHALVAKNLLSHPFKPTLIDIPYIPIAVENWGANHIWLHKPILPLWQIAISYSIFGINTWALRLPSVILSTGAVWLTYLIGRSLLNKETGFIAATLMAFSPFLMELIHGYQFSDTIDISLLFWTELSIYFLARAVRSGRWLDVGIAGFGQGCAFLSKSYLALIVTGLSLVAWLAPAFGMGKRSETYFHGKHVLGLMGTFLLTALPWTLWTALRFPIEFQHEHLYTWLHLTTNIENLEAPWYKVVLVYGKRIYGSFYIPMWIAVLVLSRKLFFEENIGLTLSYAWGFGVLFPHLLATTKTPSATLIGVPAFLLLLGELLTRSWKMRNSLNPQGHDQLVGCGSIFSNWKCTSTLVAYISVLCLTVFCGHQVWEAWKVTSQNRNHHTLSETAKFAQTQLPDNAVLLVDIDTKIKLNWDDHLRLMFLCNKTAHPFYQKAAWTRIAQQVREIGGLPYLVSFREWPLRVVFSSQTDERTIYYSPLEMSDETP